MKFRHLILAATLVLVGCGRKPAAPPPTPTPAPTPVATPTPAPPPTATPFAFDNNSAAIVLCYHRFEEKPRSDGLGLKPADFEAQMQELKDKGVAVISMADFLAWRRGEKNIPAKSAVVTLDDGWLSGYELAWPILKKFGYPFTMYIYTDYVKGGPKSGGQSMTWEQIGEMRDAGVDIGSHTISHSALNMKKGKTDEQYRAWITHELVDSKQMLEEKLGVKIKTLAYPYGNHNELVRQIAMQSGYEAAFTVYGQHMKHEGDPAMLGRYAVMSTNPKIFEQAVNFAGMAIPLAPGQGEPAVGGSPGMISMPMPGETISDPRPTLQINPAALGKVDPKTVEMRISGFGIVPAAYDPDSQLLRYKLHTRLRESQVTVIVSARTGGKKVATSWSFNFDPNVPVPTPAAPPSAPAASPGVTNGGGTDGDASLPPMKPAE